MADLPSQRMQPYTSPFLCTACDYFGPITVKISRNKSAKHYGVIFTCLNTLAVHCKLATDTSAMEFFQVLRRFFSYRGYPKFVIRQWFADGRGRTRVTSYDPKLGKGQAERILRGSWYQVAVHHPFGPAS